MKDKFNKVYDKLMSSIASSRKHLVSEAPDEEYAVVSFSLVDPMEVEDELTYEDWASQMSAIADILSKYPHQIDYDYGQSNLYSVRAVVPVDEIRQFGSMKPYIDTDTGEPNELLTISYYLTNNEISDPFTECSSDSDFLNKIHQAECLEYTSTHPETDLPNNAKDFLLSDEQIKSAKNWLENEDE
jgi:hypothetical protein